MVYANNNKDIPYIDFIKNIQGAWKLEKISSQLNENNKNTFNKPEEILTKSSNNIQWKYNRNPVSGIYFPNAIVAHSFNIKDNYFSYITNFYFNWGSSEFDHTYIPYNPEDYKMYSETILWFIPKFNIITALALAPDSIFTLDTNGIKLTQQLEPLTDLTPISYLYKDDHLFTTYKDSITAEYTTTTISDKVIHDAWQLYYCRYSIFRYIYKYKDFIEKMKVAENTRSNFYKSQKIYEYIKTYIESFCKKNIPNSVIVNSIFGDSMYIIYEPSDVTNLEIKELFNCASNTLLDIPRELKHLPKSYISHKDYEEEVLPVIWFNIRRIQYWNDYILNLIDKDSYLDFYMIFFITRKLSDGKMFTYYKFSHFISVNFSEDEIYWIDEGSLAATKSIIDNIDGVNKPSIFDTIKENSFLKWELRDGKVREFIRGNYLKSFYTYLNDMDNNTQKIGYEKLYKYLKKYNSGPWVPVEIFFRSTNANVNKNSEN